MLIGAIPHCAVCSKSCTFDRMHGMGVQDLWMLSMCDFLVCSSDCMMVCSSDRMTHQHIISCSSKGMLCSGCAACQHAAQKLEAGRKLGVTVTLALHAGTALSRKASEGFCGVIVSVCALRTVCVC